MLVVRATKSNILKAQDLVLLLQWQQQAGKL